MKVTDIYLKGKLRMRFSIIIPAHNAEKEIERALKSISNQTYKDYEIIVIDDCSNDNTYSILNKYNNITVIRNDNNIKAGGSRNKGIEKATGEYIIFLDSDDYFAENNTLEKINNVIGNETPDIIYLGFRIIGKCEEEWIPTEANSTVSKRAREWKYENVWDVCWNRDFLNTHRIRFTENRFFEDFVFYYTGIIKAKSYKIASFVTHIYTMFKDDSMTAEVTTEKLQDLYYNVNEFLNLLNDVDDKIKPDIIYAIYRVVEYSTRLLLQYEDSEKAKLLK